ncbi:MAG: LysE family translocator [Calditrichaeota bacterium]|nr:MAG: LysE family translocator [Calditrichota bacterium]
MEFQQIMSFLGASILLTLMPGPDNIFVLTESLTKGQRDGIAISLGLASGILVHTLATATGVSIVIQNSEITFTVIKYLGACYLFYLSFKAFQEQRPNVELNFEKENTKTGFGKLMRKGFFMNVLNPKVSLFFIAFLPQFVSKNGFNFTFQMIILGFIFMTQTVIIFSLIAILSGKLSNYLNSAKFWKITKWSKVSVLSVLGLTLALMEK